MSLQYDQKVTKTQKEVTVDPYFWSAIDYHPVKLSRPSKNQKSFELFLDAIASLVLTQSVPKTRTDGLFTSRKSINEQIDGLSTFEKSIN